MKRLLLLRLLFVMLALLVSGKTLAACSATQSSASFGSLSSFTLASTAQTIASGSGFSCTGGSALSLLGTNTVTATIGTSQYATGTTPQLYSTSSNAAIPFSICQEQACGTTYSVGSTITWSSTTLLGLLGLFNAPDSTLPLYFRIATGNNVPAGVYTNTLTVNWHYSICFVGLLGICSYTTGDATSTIAITLTVNNDCYIDSAPDVAFASASLPSSFKSVSSTLGVRCTLNAAYSVNLTSSNAVSGSWRQMADGSGNYLQYQLYRDGTAWTSTNNLSKTGSGTSQTINYTASVNPSQTSPPAGSYSDKVTVTVTW